LERLEKQKGKPSREEGVSWRTLVFCFSSLSTPPLLLPPQRNNPGLLSQTCQAGMNRIPAIPYPPIRHHPKMHLPEVALSCRVACVAPFIQNKSRFTVIYFRSLSSNCERERGKRKKNMRTRFRVLDSRLAKWNAVNARIVMLLPGMPGAFFNTRVTH